LLRREGKGEGLQNLWKTIWPILLDKGLLAATLLTFGYLFNRRLESFKLRLNSRREFLRAKAEMLRDLLRDMSAFQLAIIDLALDLRKERSSSTPLQDRKVAVETSTRHLLIQIDSMQPWLGEELASHGRQLVGIGQKMLGQAKQSVPTDNLERDMEAVQLTFVKAARRALGEEK
jgi:hypothetical protein